MKKQILAVMVGLSVALAGCSTQSTESMLQEVKKDTKEVKSGKLTMTMDSTDIDKKPIGFNVSGDEKFDPLEANIKGTLKQAGIDSDIESYIKDGVEYFNSKLGNDIRWGKSKFIPGGRESYNFKKNALNMQDSILNLLDNKDNWDVTKDDDKVTFKLKKNDETKKKVEEGYLKIVKKNDGKAVKFSKLDYTIEYVFNKKTKNIEKIFNEVIAETDDNLKIITTELLEEINKEVKIELPEESKNAITIEV